MDMAGGGEEGEGWIYGDSNIETHITICKLDSQWEFANDSRNSNLGSVTTQRGGMEREVGGRFKRKRTYIYLWLTHASAWQKPTQYCNAIIL